MMTVFYKPMRRRRWMRIEAGQAPPTWATFPMHDKGVQGSAKPGRGGRRKRRRLAAGMRAARLYGTAIVSSWVGAPMPSGMGSALDRANRLTPHMMVTRIVGPGRRERRRRAKLRRRRARAEAQGRRATLVNPLDWCGPSMAAQTYREAVGWANREIIRTIAGAPPEMRLDRPQVRIKI